MSHIKRTKEFLARQVHRRWQFTGVIAGLVVGIAIGTVGAQAQVFTVFLSARQASAAPDIANTWYVAGMFDMLAEVGHFESVDVLRRKYVCLQAKSRYLDGLAAWAKYRWTVASQTYPEDPASEIFLSYACEP
jgi:hypothetical protein